MKKFSLSLVGTAAVLAFATMLPAHAAVDVDAA
jgi:hypothetical protein